MVSGVCRDLAKPLHRHGLAGQRFLPPSLFGTGFHPHIDAQAGHYRSVAAAAGADGQADYIVGLLLDVFQVPAGAADIGGGEVSAAQGVYETPVGADQGLGLLGVGVGDDHTFASAQGQVGGRRLICHGPGQPQSVPERFLFRLVRPDSGSAAGRAQGCVVNGNDRFQA